MSLLLRIFFAIFLPFIYDVSLKQISSTGITCHFLPPDMHTYAGVSGGDKCYFSGKTYVHTKWMMPSGRHIVDIQISQPLFIMRSSWRLPTVIKIDFTTRHCSKIPRTVFCKNNSGWPFMDTTLKKAQSVFPCWLLLFTSFNFSETFCLNV